MRFEGSVSRGRSTRSKHKDIQKRTINKIPMHHPLLTTAIFSPAYVWRTPNEHHFQDDPFRHPKQGECQEGHNRRNRLEYKQHEFSDRDFPGPSEQPHLAQQLLQKERELRHLERHQDQDHLGYEQREHYDPI